MRGTRKIIDESAVSFGCNRTRKKVCPDYNSTADTFVTESEMRQNQQLSEKREQMGWKIIEMRGGAFERGVQHGSALFSELAQLKRALQNLVRKEYKTSFVKYAELCAQAMPPVLFELKWPEWKTEMDGIVAGALQHGVVISFEFLLQWNMYLSMAAYYGKTHQRCSAFIATGEATADGKIVMAHNTHSTFEEAALSNIIAYIYPNRGHAFVMQTMPGLVSSSMDWFITSAGLMGCETTTADHWPLPTFPHGAPYFCRIRECMQYGISIDEYVHIMTSENAGDYACAWLFGDIHTNEIARLELGKMQWTAEKTGSGAFVGANWTKNDALRQTETKQKMGSSCFLRNTRLEELVQDKYWGKMDVARAKKVLADHHDPSKHDERSNTDNKHKLAQGNGYSICRHMEKESRVMPSHEPHDLYGTIDGKVTTTEMAKKLAFWGRWGSSCGRVFSKEDHAKKYPEYKSLLSKISNFSGKPWTKIAANQRGATTNDSSQKIEQVFMIKLN